MMRVTDVIFLPETMSLMAWSTHGMEQLLREEMLRLSGKSYQVVFELNQLMDGGKTHMMMVRDAAEILANRLQNLRALGQ